MKRLLLLLFFICLVFTGCSDDMESMLSVDIMVLENQEASNLISISKLIIMDDELKLQPNSYLSLKNDDYDINTIVYRDNNRLFFTPSSISGSSTTDLTLMSVNSTDLFYDTWSLTKRDNNWYLTNDIIEYNELIKFDVNGDFYSPICFYEDVDNSEIVVLCNYLYTASEFSVYVFRLDIQNQEIRYVSCDSSFHQYEISPVQYPVDSFSCFPMTDGFLYNEGAEIYKINGETGELQSIFNESMIMQDVPLLDSYRDAYSFFDSASYRNNYYMLSFPAYNELAGRYVALYNDSFEYQGCILITENKIILYDKNNSVIDEITGNFVVYCYI